MHAGIVGRGGIDQQPRSQGDGRAPPRQQRLLAGGTVDLCNPVPMIPEALAAQRLGGSGPHTGPHRALVPLGDGPLACGPGRTLEGRQKESGPHGQRGAAPWRGGRDVGLDQRQAPQFLGPGREQRRGPALPGLHGVERGPGPLGGRGSPLDTDGLHAPLLRTQIALLDKARLALDTGGAAPGERRSSCVPLGKEPWHTGRGIPIPVYVQHTLLKLKM